MYLAADSLLNGMRGWWDDQVRDEIMRLSLADTWLHAARGQSTDYLPYPKVEFHARHWLRGPCKDERTPRGQLTTRLLLKCASTIDEMLMRGEDQSATWEEIRRFGHHALMNTEYGLAAHIATDLLGPYLNIPTTLALIDWSLNPPVPMFEITDRTITWREFYPPARFIDACQTLADGYPHAALSEGLPHEYERFRAALTARGLRYGHVDVPLRGAYEITFPDASEGLVAFYGPLLQASATLLLRRNTHPDHIAMPRTYIATEFKAKDSTEAANYIAEFAKDMTPYYPFATVQADAVEPGFGMTTQDVTNFLAGALTLVALDSAVNE